MLNHARFIYCRNDDSEARRDALSNETRRLSRQRISVNIYISFLSWVWEFILGFLYIILTMVRYLLLEDANFFDRWHRLLDSFILFIVLPCTYVINSEKTKEIIILQNWYQGIRSTFLPSIQVAPTGGPDPPAQPRNDSAFARNIYSNEEPPERIAEEDKIEDESPDTQTPPRLSAQPSDTQPSAIPSNPLNSNNTFRGQLPRTEVIPLSNIRVITVESIGK